MEKIRMDYEIAKDEQWNEKMTWNVSNHIPTLLTLLESLHQQNKEKDEKLAIAIEALQAVANDEEAGKWGPDITTAGHARQALSKLTNE